MEQEICTIKGSREGLVITITDGTQFQRVLDSLAKQLSASQSFFAGSSAKVSVRQGSLDTREMDQLEQLVNKYGMHLNREVVLSAEANTHNLITSETDEAEQQEDNTLLVRRTIRSGQRLHYDGNVVVMGDVNPGAEIVCTGDILVLGSLRGVAHAGAEGKVDASVFAFRLEPTQLRIANLISRAPDEKLPQPSRPEIARVVENNIQLSVYSY